MTEKTWMLWDGTCGMCSACAAWLYRHDRDERLQVCQYQNAPTPPVPEQAVEWAKYSFVSVEPDGRIRRGAQAVFTGLRTLGYWWVTPLIYPPFNWILSPMYWLVARNRSLISRVFFKGGACGLEGRYPDVEDRA